MIGPWSGWINGRQWAEIFWLIALLPAVGIAAWWVLSGREIAPQAGTVRVAST